MWNISLLFNVHGRTMFNSNSIHVVSYLEVTSAEKPQMKLKSFKKQKHGYLINI